jgi:N utilization substance protein B
MINRRLLRIKALQIIYAFYNKPDISLQQAENELLQSIEKTYDLYFLLISIIEEVKEYAQKIIDYRLSKNIKTEEDKNPSLKFVRNNIITQITINDTLLQKIKERKLSWKENPELIKKLYLNLTESDEFIQYMSKPESDFEEDKKIIQFFYSEIIYNSKDLYSVLEEQSIYWNYEIDFTIDLVLKSLDKIVEGKFKNFVIKDIYKKEDDLDFVKILLRKTIIKGKEYEKIISDNIINWEFERVLKTDRLILMLAISEIIEFKSIPVKVSFNEYIEIAKQFGSEKSGSFINGVLEKIIAYLREENKFEKTGRGLV